MVTATVTSALNIPTTATIKEKFSLIIFLRGGLIALCLFMMFAALHPETRAAIRIAVNGENSRKVLSTAQGYLAGGNDRLFTILKVKTHDAVSLEIFEHVGNGHQKLVERLQLADARDGFFDFNGQATNLAVDDVNGDGRPEILAPSFDNNMVGHLNVFNFDIESGSFQKVVR